MNRSLVLLLALVGVFLSLSPGLASEPSAEKHWTTHSKAGWFVWDEQIDGADFIRDEGMMYAVGVTRTDRIYKNLYLSATIELWSGRPEYDGENMFTRESIQETNLYIGTREDIRASLKLAASDGIALTPFIGISHKFWGRAMEGEVWNTIYSPVGFRAEYPLGKDRLIFVEGGLTVPWYTSNRMYMRGQGIGYEDVTLKPESKVGQFI